MSVFKQNVRNGDKMQIRTPRMEYNNLLMEIYQYLTFNISDKKHDQPRLNAILGKIEICVSPIQIGGDGLCTCSCATPCPLHKTGSEGRCSEEELKSAGILTRSYNGNRRITRDENED